MIRDLAAGPRILLRRLRELTAEPLEPQDRLDRIVLQIARNMVAEVCSVYVLRADGVLELYATEGLNKESVHHAQLKMGEGLGNSTPVVAGNGRFGAMPCAPMPSRASSEYGMRIHPTTGAG